MSFFKMSAAFAAVLMALTASAAPILEERTPPGFLRVQAQPGNRIATKDNTIVGTSIHNDAAAAAPGPSTPFQITFNNSYTDTSATLFAYVVGMDLNGASFFLQNDGSVYYPPNPTAAQGNVAVTNAAVNIQLNPSGQLTTVGLPVYCVGARAYYSVGELNFYVNNGGAGAAVVGPSLTNPSDTNADTLFSWLEFSYHDDDEGGYYSNLSYVDLVSIVAQQTLTTTDGATCHVDGLPPTGLADICNAYTLLDQTYSTRLAHSCQMNNASQLVRAVSMEHLLEIPGESGDFAGYYDDYVNSVFEHYTSTPLTVTRSGTTYTGQVDASGNMTFNTGDSFGKPSVQDIFGCGSGPFANVGPQSRKDIAAPLCAAFVRGTLLLDGGNNQPDGVGEDQYYSTEAPAGPVFWWGKYVHQYETDGRGYAFAYDDVVPAGGVDSSGECHGSAAGVTYTIGI